MKILQLSLIIGSIIIVILLVSIAGFSRTASLIALIPFIAYPIGYLIFLLFSKNPETSMKNWLLTNVKIKLANRVFLLILTAVLWSGNAFLFIFMIADTKQQQDSIESPLRYSYYNLSEYLVDNILDGHPIPPYKDAVVISNELSDTLLSLRKKFFVKTFYNNYSPDEVHIAGKSDETKISDTAVYWPKVYLPATSTQHSEVTFYLNTKEIYNIIKPFNSWHITSLWDRWLVKEDSLLFYNYMIPPKLIIYNRYLTDEDFEHLLQLSLKTRKKVTPTKNFTEYRNDNNQIIKFFRHITKNYLPEKFIALSIDAYNSDYFNDNKFYYRFLGPPLCMQILVIENISNKTIRLEDFQFKCAKFDRLYSNEEMNNLIDKTKMQNEDIFTLKKLKPNETIIVPIKAFFNVKHFYENNRELESKLRKLHSKGAQLYFDPPNDSLTIRLDRFYKNNLQGTDSTLTYHYGPTYNYYSITVDNKSYDIRFFQPKHMFIRWGLGGGLCPYVFITTEINQEWHNIGPILYKHSSPEHDVIEEIKLTSKLKRLKIAELEYESSYIDYVYLRIKTNTDKEHIFPCTDNNLNKIDKKYCVLNFGDEVEINFESYAHIRNIKELYLGVKGYYMPYSQKLLSQRF